VRIELTEAARRWLAHKGYDKQYGARPMARVIQEKIKAPVAEEILFGSLQQGGTVSIDETGGELALKFEGKD
jgi:ATP-dependent Clp protease ATP-binding subunit ClpA